MTDNVKNKLLKRHDLTWYAMMASGVVWAKTISSTPIQELNFVNDNPLFHYSALSAIGIGVSLHLATFASLFKDKVNKEEVSKKGLFSMVRHPAYLGMRLALTGTALIHPSLETIAATTLMYITTEATARAEEEYLEYMHPSYRDFKERTPRWIPSGKSIQNLFRK